MYQIAHCGGHPWPPQPSWNLSSQMLPKADVPGGQVHPRERNRPDLVRHSLAVPEARPQNAAHSVGQHASSPAVPVESRTICTTPPFAIYAASFWSAMHAETVVRAGTSSSEVAEPLLGCRSSHSGHVRGLILGTMSCKTRTRWPAWWPTSSTDSCPACGRSRPRHVHRDRPQRAGGMEPGIWRDASRCRRHRSIPTRCSKPDRSARRCLRMR